MENKVILLVEDNPDDEELTIRSLEKDNIDYQIVVVHDGAEALDYLFGKGEYKKRDISIMPVIIMLDIKLPKISGLEVLKQIRANTDTQLLPVVILTSSDDERDLIESYELGANSYIRKPVNFNEFQKTVQQLSSYWILLNSAPPIIRKKT
jgi:two-component system response regulator